MTEVTERWDLLCLVSKLLSRPQTLPSHTHKVDLIPCCSWIKSTGCSHTEGPASYAQCVCVCVCVCVSTSIRPISLCTSLLLGATVMLLWARGFMVCRWLTACCQGQQASCWSVRLYISGSHQRQQQHLLCMKVNKLTKDFLLLQRQLLQNKYIKIQQWRETGAAASPDTPRLITAESANI